MPDLLAIKARLRAVGLRKPKAPPGLSSARAKFDEQKHPRAAGGKFADVPGRGDDAPRKGRAHHRQARLRKAIEHADRRAEALKRKGVAGAKYEAALDRAIALKRAAEYGSRVGSERARLRAEMAARRPAPAGTGVAVRGPERFATRTQAEAHRRDKGPRDSRAGQLAARVEKRRRATADKLDRARRRGDGEAEARHRERLSALAGRYDRLAATVPGLARRVIDVTPPAALARRAAEAPPAPRAIEARYSVEKVVPAAERAARGTPGRPEDERRGTPAETPTAAAGGRGGSLAGGHATEGARARRASRAVNKLMKLRRERTMRREGFDPAATADHPPGYLGELKTDLIHFDPRRFQYKLAQTNQETGAVGSLAGVKKWDPELAGVISVWKDPGDGKVYVVNGHNRLDLAHKLGVERIGVRYLNARDHVMARAKGALANIAEGRGTSTDAAKFFRDTGITDRGMLESRGIPLTEAKTQEGLALAGLSDPLFRRIVDGSLPTSKGAIIGGGGLTHDQQKSVADALDKSKGKMPDAELREAVDDARHAGSRQKDDGPDLFGDTSDESIAPYRWNLIANVKSRLSEEKNLFGTVSKKNKAEKLAAAGNTIDAEASGKISAEAETALRVFDGLKRTSIFNGTLNEYAGKLAEAKNDRERKQIRDELYAEIRKRVQDAEILN